MQSGQNWCRDDGSGSLRRPRYRCVFGQAEARAGFIIIGMSKRLGSDADVVRHRSKHDPGTRAEAFRLGVQRMGFATATSVRWGGRESPSFSLGW